VLLVRAPYGKDQMTIGGSDSFDILRAVPAGYVVVAQERPRPLRLRRRIRAERRRDQGRCGHDHLGGGSAVVVGVVGTFGGSYLGGTQWLPPRRTRQR
jgi:uncharacterized protein